MHRSSAHNCTMKVTAVAMQRVAGELYTVNTRARVFTCTRFTTGCGPVAQMLRQTQHKHTMLTPTMRSTRRSSLLVRPSAVCVVSDEWCQPAYAPPTALQELPQARRPQDGVIQADHHPRASIQHPNCPCRYVCAHVSHPFPTVHPKQHCLACQPMKAPPLLQPCWACWACFSASKQPASALSLMMRRSRCDLCCIDRGGALCVGCVIPTTLAGQGWRAA